MRIQRPQRSVWLGIEIGATGTRSGSRRRHATKPRATDAAAPAAGDLARDAAAAARAGWHGRTAGAGERAIARELRLDPSIAALFRSAPCRRSPNCASPLMVACTFQIEAPDQHLHGILALRLRLSGGAAGKAADTARREPTQQHVVVPSPFTRISSLPTFIRRDSFASAGTLSVRASLALR